MNNDTNLKAKFAKGRILFLDDNDDTCELVELILNQAGYEVVLGRSVEEKEVSPRIAKHLGELLGLEMKEASVKAILEKLEQVEPQLEVPA